jgi:hypothetical protein
LAYNLDNNQKVHCVPMETLTSSAFHVTDGLGIGLSLCKRGLMADGKFEYDNLVLNPPVRMHELKDCPSYSYFGMRVTAACEGVILSLSS